MLVPFVVYLVIVLMVVVPIGWFASEFQERRWLRLALGTFAILLSFGVALLIGATFERLNSNAWFGEATGNLLQATVVELEAGRPENALRSLKQLQQEYRPTYENRARYDVLVEEAVARMRTAP
ncbi:hypothetical protein [Planctomyces sp. SH-PL62]|uniref:hypothetical protein n=1 Tax=Planctomyces sp. SH-PL62 TaxID=1636152 RepID=UPI00078E4A57|nr:hypothetical protein [Planctomyces sp. SH-PL62]AMV41000.1 hypothetical protein VT85_26430 [Planctomyces sp. SH-PL62]